MAHATEAQKRAMRVYYQRHKEEIALARKQYYAENKLAADARTSNWNQHNRSKRNQIAMKSYYKNKGDKQC